MRVISNSNLIAGNNSSLPLRRPGASEDGKVIAWSQATKKYQLNTSNSSAAGSNRQIQYSDGLGGFLASANFTWDEANKRLNLSANNSSIQLGTAGNLRISEVIGTSMDLGAYGFSGYRVRVVDNSIVHASFGANSYVFGGATPTAGSVLVDFQSTNRGILFPRADPAAITTPVWGMFTVGMDQLPYFYEGLQWRQLHLKGENLLVLGNGPNFHHLAGIGGTTYAWERVLTAGNTFGNFTLAFSLPATIPNNITVFFEVDLIGITPDTGAGGYCFKYIFCFRKNNAGTWTQIGAITTVFAVYDPPLVPLAPTFQILGTADMRLNFNFQNQVSIDYRVYVRLRTGN
ncbi:MAG: hypothetical protein ACK47E_09445 [Cyclobacteriaceae bacterium]